MRRHPKFHIKLENESNLTDIVDIKVSRFGLVGLITLTVAVIFLLAGVTIMITPLKTLLPGYMKQSQRSATEESILKLDSIQAVYQKNQAYIESVLRAFDTERQPEDSIQIADEVRIVSSDSLLPASPSEKRFVSAMAERERFNISVLAPLAAESMMFSPVSDAGVFTAASKNDTHGQVLMPVDEPVKAIADGSVLASYYSPKDGGYVIVLQHSKGFVSRYEGLGDPVTSPGDMVLAGQVLAMGPRPDSHGHRIAGIMMWHNGVPLVPYEYIGANISSNSSPDESYEAPRGR